MEVGRIAGPQGQEGKKGKIDCGSERAVGGGRWTVLLRHQHLVNKFPYPANVYFSL
jgi:hypothetical protein